MKERRKQECARQISPVGGVFHKHGPLTDLDDFGWYVGSLRCVTAENDEMKMMNVFPHRVMDVM